MAAPHGMWDLSSPTKDRTCTPCSGSTGFFLSFLNYIFIYFVALGLGCCMQAFFSCGKEGLLSTWCAGFSLRWLLLMQSTGSTTHRPQ